MIKKTKTVLDMRVLIGQPKYYPHELTIMLGEYFATHKSVKRAYLGCAQYPDDSNSLKLLICIDTNDDIIKLISALDEKLNSISIKNNIDFVRFDDTAFKSYFEKIKPFYEN